MPSTHTADFQTAALKATDLEAVEKINVGLETELARKQLNIIADAPEIRIQDKTGSASETTMSIVADGGATHFRAGIDTFAEGTETKGNVKFQSSTGATTHAEIVGSSGKLELQDGGLGLKLGSNVSVTGTSSVIQEITGPHARESAVLKKYPEVPLTSNVQSGYVASASSEYSINYQIWKAHDGETVFGTAPSYYYSTATQAYSTTNGSYTGATFSTTSSGTAYAGEYVQMQFPTPIKLSYMRIVSPDAGATYNKNSPKQGVICGSNDGTTWTTIAAYSGITYATLGASAIIQAPSNVAYKYIRLVATHIEGVGSTGWLVIEELEYYGYEDVGAGDDSVDTTVKSVYNAPDLTSAALYIDGKKSGSTPTDYGPSNITVTDNGTWDSSDNTWSLSGATTSNLVSADLGFVGDQPHSVSAWVKADRLNGSGLFHVGTAEGEGDAASRVGFVDDSHISWGGADHFFSNTEWHNVTYTYNGEGSDKKLYLDGRLVGTAKNEDTFGEYPPFAMSTYSEYGYTVSASSELAGNGYLAWEAFDRVTGGTSGQGGASDQAWISANLTYQGNTYNSTKNLGTDHGGSATASGEYLILELPHKLRLSYVAISPRGSETTHAPRDGKVYGSNDRVNWTEIGSFTGLEHSTGKYASVTVNATTGFKMFAVVTTAILFSNAAAWLGIGELKYYGHRENDLVRFPDSVNVLKYPRVAMTGPAQRGYVVTASSIYSPAYDVHYALNETLSPANQGYSYWSSADHYTSAGAWDTNFNTDQYKTVASATDYYGDFIEVEFPRKITLSHITIHAVTTAQNMVNRLPCDGVVAGWNGSSWDAIKIYSNFSVSASTHNTLDVNASSAYSKIRLVVTSLQKNVSLQFEAVAIDILRFYGTESGDVVARVGDGFDGKVRNLRVYSTALSDARAQEIFDADKDEFGLAKSSVSVYRGHLGVGTDTPKAALTVMDEVAELEEFPPSAMTAEETYIEGHGVFGLHHSGYNASGPIIRAFNKKAPFGDFWYSNTSIYQGTGNLYSGSAISPNGVAGEWMYMTLPYHVDMKYLEITARNGEENSAPNTAIIFGSADGGVTWEQVGGWSGKTTSNHWLGSGVPSPPFTINSTKPLNAIGFVVTHGNGWYAFTLGEIRFFGARERGASTLHNGELSLTRNLTVPRIGPPLDADDTPRRDRLVVEYNTSTNPMENGVVKDTSGRGLDGRIRNAGTTYDSTGKWFQCTASDGSQWIDTRIDSGGSRLSEGISGSIWVNQKYFDTSTKNSFIWSVGDRSGTGNNREIAITYNAVGQTLKSYYVSFNGGSGNLNVYHTSQTPFDVWTHVGMTYDGTTVKLYINGVYSASNTITDVNIPETNCFLRLNGDVVSANSTHQGTPMNLSNFKLYDVALTADEVKRLYDMGRCDEGHHTTHVYKSKLQMRGENLVIEPCIRGFYEEGTWIPLIGGHTSGRKTPNSANYGWFIRVGNMVTIGGTVGWDGGDSTLNGYIVLDGIPYPSRSTTNARAAMSFGVVGSNGITTGSGYNVLRLVLDPGYPYIWFIQANEHGSTTVTYNHNPGVASSGYIYGIGGSYMI